MNTVAGLTALNTLLLLGLIAAAARIGSRLDRLDAATGMWRTQRRMPTPGRHAVDTPTAVIGAVDPVDEVWIDNVVGLGDHWLDLHADLRRGARGKEWTS